MKIIKKNIILTSFLAVLSLNSFAGTVTPGASFGTATHVVVAQNGTTSLVMAKNAKGDIFVGKAQYVPGEGTYYGKHEAYSHVRSAANGAVSNGTVKATIEHQVSKRAVTDEIFKKAKIAGRALGKGAAGLGRAAASRHPLGLAFALALEGLAGSKMFWDDEQDEFVKPDDGSNYYLFLTNEANSIGASMTESDFNRWCAGTVTIHASYDSKLKGTQRTCEDIEIVKKSELTTEKYLRKCGGTREEKYELNAHRACVKDNKLMGKAVKTVRYIGHVPITADDFFRESVPDADKNPNEWVDTSEVKPDNDPSVTVPAGTVAQTDPYTDPQDGKTKQTRWDFEPNGRVRETVIPRPDLTPDSPQAPQLKPMPETPDTASASEPQSASEPKAASAPADLCEQNPDIMACDKQPEEPELDEFPEIPTETINLKFTPDNVFPSQAVCPAPVSFSWLDKTYSFSLQPACDLAEAMRAFIIATAFLMAAFFVVRTVQSEV